MGYGPWIPDWYIHMSSVPIFLYSEHGLSLMKSGDKPRSGHLNDKNVSIPSDCIGMTANIIWSILYVSHISVLSAMIYCKYTMYQ